MQEIFVDYNNIIWIFAILAAWFFGEIGHHITKIPRISFYVLVGFLFSQNQIGIFQAVHSSEVNFLINVAISVLIFEFGYRINLKWLRKSPIIIITGVTESLATFILVFVLARLINVPTPVALQYAAFAIATSPVVLMYVIGRRQSSGQVTERMLHLSAINCIIAIFAFKLIFILPVLRESAEIIYSTVDGLVTLVLSILTGILFAFLLSFVIRAISSIANNVTMAIFLFVVCIVIIMQINKFSPILAVLSFGITARYLNIAMGKQQRNFGVLGELLTILLFVAVPIGINWHYVFLGIWIPLILILARSAIKIFTVSIFSHYSGMPWKKSILTGLALSPLGVFSILMVNQNYFTDAQFHEQLAGFSIVVLLVDLVGPIIINYALIRAKESL